MSFPVSTFWPHADALPTRRVVQAALLAPLVISVVLVGMIVLIAGMTEPTGTEVISVTLNAGRLLVPLLFGFMLTFGAIGVMALWLLRQRGLLSWAVCGALMGALASLLMGELLLGDVMRPMLIGSTMVGWSMLLLFRWFAGIRADQNESLAED